MNARAWVWTLLETVRGGGRAAVLMHRAIMTLIILNALAVILASVQSMERRWSLFFDAFELFSVAVFSLEYLARVWACTADPRFAGPIRGRLRYVLTPLALIDLLAILPSYLIWLHLDLRIMRSLRLIRLARVGKMGRYSTAAAMIVRVVKSLREELLLSLSMLAILATVCATLMYFVEGQVQPEAFPSIPAALWWSFVTITTVGYGDVYPITPLGRILGITTTLLGILMLALPTGLFSAAFIEEVHRRRQAHPQKSCPHCGKPLE